MTRRPSNSASYKIIRPLASGGMAEVYVADAEYPNGTHAMVAIKRVLPQFQGDRALAGMLVDEARVGLRLDHPNLVPVLELNQQGRSPFLVMEYVDGLDLLSMTESLLAAGGRFERFEAVEICIQISLGLQSAHDLTDEHGEPLRLVHRDVTPPNILLSKHGRARLCDFGLAKASTQFEATAPGVIKGKYGYLSPEGALGANVDVRADVFSLGIVLWEMLAMRRLFRGEHDYATVQLVQAAKIPRLAPLNSDVDEVLQEIVDKALARDPARRYPSAEAFGNALTAYQDWQEISFNLRPLVARAREAAATARSAAVAPDSPQPAAKRRSKTTARRARGSRRRKRA